LLLLLLEFLKIGKRVLEKNRLEDLVVTQPILMLIDFLIFGEGPRVHRVRHSIRVIVIVMRARVGRGFTFVVLERVVGTGGGVELHLLEQVVEGYAQVMQTTDHTAVEYGV